MIDNRSKEDRVEQGRKNYSDGYKFEDRVADLYRLLNYRVEHGRLFSGRQVDMFMTNQFGDMTIYRAIECKAGNVTVDDIDAFLIKLGLVKREYPSAYGTIVSGSSFTDAVCTQANHTGISIITARELANQLIDGNAYARSLILEIENNERYPLSMYIEPSIGITALDSAVEAFLFFDDWVNDSNTNQLTLLGDVGTGKSFFSRMVAYRLAKSFLQEPLSNPLPILIDLRQADREFSLEGLVITHLNNSGLSKTSFDIFSYLLSQGYLVLLLDGFDEMAAKITPQVTNRNFQQLSRCVKNKSKVILTCRTHYFKSRTEEEEVILGGSKDYGSETAKDLYWELISRKGFSIAYLRPFSITQVEEYVQKAKGSAAKDALQKIRQTYNLMELSSRPMLLEMIVKSIDRLNTDDINASKLYEVFTDAWIHRDKWRDAISSELKLKLLMALAVSLWTTDSSFIHYKELAQYLSDKLSDQVQDPHQLIEIDNEIRTASFLTRDEKGFYGFAHKSYLEFFYAKHLATLSSDNSFKWLHTRRLSPEIICFLSYLIATKKIEPSLEVLLTQEYKPYISENALLCLYGFRRERLMSDNISAGKQSQGQIQILLPDQMQLSMAQLNQVNLEGAVMREANLQGASLYEAILSDTDLSKAVLDKSNFERATFRNSKVESASLSHANFKGANFEGTTLTNAVIANSILTDAYFMHASLNNAVLDNSILNGAVFPDTYSAQSASGDLATTQKQTLSSLQWQKIEKHLEVIKRQAEIFVSRYLLDLEPDDLASEIVIALASPSNTDKLDNISSQYIANIGYTCAQMHKGNSDGKKEITFTEMSEHYSDFETELQNIPTEEHNPLEYLLTSELSEKLSDDAKQIFSYYYIYGFSIQEISDLTKYSVYKIRNILSKISDILREEFGGYLT